MTVKQIVFHEAAREGLRRGVDALAEAVKITLGPRGRTVILERAYGGPQIVNSGVVVARSIELDDRVENLGAQLLREVAARTSEMAGDGTTTATVLAQSMIHEGLRCLAGGLNPMDLRQGITQAIERVVEELKQLARPCTESREIAHVATISANNDRSIGNLLAEAIDKVGRTGAISIEEGSGLTSVLELVEGLQFDRGFLSPYFINTPDRQGVILEQANLLLVDGKLSSLNELLPLLEELAKSGAPLLVIAEDLDPDTLAALVINSIRGSLKACAVRAPGFGDRRREMLHDIAILTGATVASREMGTPLSKISIEQLGRVKRAEITKDNTTLIGGAGAPEQIAHRVQSIRQERDRAPSQFDRDRLEERAAKLSGGVALIKIGAATETELKERRLRVEDALHATRAAVEEGIVPGGGVALLRAREVLRRLEGVNLDERSGIQIVYRALESPLRCIVENAGDEPSVIVEKILQDDAPALGYNAASKVYGDMMDMGVIDPAKVTRLALQNAGSIASLMLATNCAIVNNSPSQSQGTSDGYEQPMVG